MITRGVGELEADTETCTDPAAIIIVGASHRASERIYQEGVDVVISSVRRARGYQDRQPDSSGARPPWAEASLRGDR